MPLCTESPDCADWNIAVGDRDHPNAAAAPPHSLAWPHARHDWYRRLAWLRTKPSAIVLAMLIVITNTVLGVVAVHGLRDGFTMIRQGDAAVAALARLSSETGQAARHARGFLLLRQPQQRARFYAARDLLTQQIVRLRMLTAGSPAQQRRLDAVQRWLSQESAAVEAPPAAGALQSAAAPLQQLDAEEQRLVAVRAAVDAIRGDGQAAQAGRFDIAEQRINRAFVISECRTFLSIGLIVLVVLLIWRDRKLRSAIMAERAAAIAEANQALRQEAAERRQAEQALRRRDLMLRGLTDAIPQMVFVLNRDGSGELLNRGWHEYTGAPSRFSRNQGLELVHPDDAVAVRARWRQAVRAVAPFAAEFRLRGKDGLYRWFLAQSVPIADPEDESAARWVGALTNIDDVRRADTALRESEDRFRRIFEGSPFGITLSEGDGRRILQANPAFCKMLGYTPDELTGRSLVAITHPDETPVQRIFPSLDAAGPGWRMREKRYLTKQGAVVWARIRVSVFDPHGGGGPQLLSVVEDITRQRELDEALRHAQRTEAIGQLSGGIAHDFNNLLGVIIGNVECLLATLEDDPERAELAREVLQSALGGAELTRRLLTFGRRQSLSPQQIELGAEVARQINLLRRALSGGVRVETVFDDDLWPVQADPSQLGDALLNLAINARDAMPDGGVVTIDAYNDRVQARDAANRAGVAPGEYAVLAVSDTGIGMRPEVRARAIEPFFTTKPPGAGSGLGLSMVYGFVRQSGGHLTISSEVGIGTTVSLFLPRAAGEGDAMAASQADASGLPTGCETILLVEDNLDMQQVTQRHLRFLGYKVLTAENGPAALALLRTGTAVDLLFTDIAMPEGITGFQLARAACAMRPDLKVLFTTGYAGQRHPGAEADWQAPLIYKPYRRSELAEVLRETLNA